MARGMQARTRLAGNNNVFQRYTPLLSVYEENKLHCVYILIILLFMNSKGNHEDKLHVIKRRPKIDA